MTTDTKFTEADLKAANARLKMLTYYPSDPEAQAAIMELLACMCPSREALEWVVTTMVNRVGAWKGPVELRGVLCWRFPPADGMEANCSIAGFRPEDGERETLNRHAVLKQGGCCDDSLKMLRGVVTVRLSQSPKEACDDRP